MPVLGLASFVMMMLVLVRMDTEVLGGGLNLIVDI